LVFAPVRSGNGAKLSSARLWLNASKSESVLETMMLVPQMLVGPNRLAVHHTGVRSLTEMLSSVLNK
jgi:hypothetical protein